MSVAFTFSRCVLVFMVIDKDFSRNCYVHLCVSFFSWGYPVCILCPLVYLYHHSLGESERLEGGRQTCSQKFCNEVESFGQKVQI